MGTINARFEQYYGQMVLLFAVSGLLAVLIIRELRKIFASVLADDCFVRENVESLNRMGTYSFLIVLVSVGEGLSVSDAGGTGHRSGFYCGGFVQQGITQRSTVGELQTGE